MVHGPDAAHDRKRHRSRILHRAGITDGRPVRWREIAQATGRDLLASTQFQEIVGWEPDAEHQSPPEPWREPDPGSLRPSECAAVAEVLALHTTTPGVLQVRRYRVKGEHAGDMLYDETEPPPSAGAIMVDPADLTRRKHFGPDAQFEESLQRSGMTRADMEARLRDTLITNKVFSRELRNREDLTDKELRERYDREKERYRLPERARLRMSDGKWGKPTAPVTDPAPPFP